MNKDYLTECIKELKNTSQELYNQIKSEKQLNFEEAYNDEIDKLSNDKE